MRPKLKTFTLAASNDDGFLNDATGTGPWTTILAQPSDDCGHQITITSASNLSTITFTCVGTDSENRTLTETITGPNATIATGSYYFKTLVSVTASATIGASTMDVGWAEGCKTPIYPTGTYLHGAANIAVNLGGTVNYTVQQSNDNIFDNQHAQWHTLGTANTTSGQMLEASDAVTAVRVLVNSHTSGILYVTHSQARS